jgi:hypothetical protein
LEPLPSTNRATESCADRQSPWQRRRGSVPGTRSPLCTHRLSPHPPQVKQDPSS